MTKIGFVSLGCSKNLVDTELMLRKLYDAGYEITPDESEAEIIIVNTCGFIESAKQESIDNILDVADVIVSGTQESAMDVAAGATEADNGDV